MNTQATFKTERAGRYLASLCHHFGRKVPVQIGETSGRIEFPFGQCRLEADDTHLKLTVQAVGEADLMKTVDVVSSHLERFAFRENPVLDWHPASAGAF